MEKKTVSPEAIAALEKASQYLSVGHYSPNTVRNYLSELRYLFSYYCEVSPHGITEDQLLQYLVYLAKTLGCSRVKCRMAAQSIAFFCRHVLKRPLPHPFGCLSTHGHYTAARHVAAGNQIIDRYGK